MGSGLPENGCQASIYIQDGTRCLHPEIHESSLQGLHPQCDGALGVPTLLSFLVSDREMLPKRGWQWPNS